MLGREDAILYSDSDVWKKRRCVVFRLTFGRRDTVLYADVAFGSDCNHTAPPRGAVRPRITRSYCIASGDF